MKTFITRRAAAVWLALRALWIQSWLWLDQGANAVGLGLGAVFMAAATGEEQATCYADETLSAHAWRAEVARKPWALRFRPFIDWLFRRQGRSKTVDAALKRAVSSHCERAFWSKRLRLQLPRAYRD